MHRKRWFLLIGALVSLLSLAVFAAACGEEGEGEATPTAGETPVETPAETPATPAETPGETPAGATVDVSLAEFEVVLSQDTVAAGPVTFNVSNDGSIAHNLRVISTDLAEDDLPVSGGAVDEDELDVVGSTADDLDAGDTGEVQVTLEAGNYVVICNVPGHYTSDMRTTLTAQ